MDSPQISVIVPVYKVEKYLCKCINSILTQSYRNFELILIDDGSPDNSGRICDEYVEKDKRVRTFHKRNGGVSSARNFGLDQAKGDWVLFVDADDWIDKECFEICLNRVVQYNLDFLQYSYQRVTDEGIILYKNNEFTGPLDFVDFAKTNSFLACVCGSVLKREILNENVIKFDENLKLAEDQIFIYTVMTKSKRLMKIKNEFYKYRYNIGSATCCAKKEDLISSINALKEFKYRSLFENRIQDAIFSQFFALLKYKDISSKEIYDLIASENFQYVDRDKRKLFKIYLVIHNVSKLMAVKIVRLLAK